MKRYALLIFSIALYINLSARSIPSRSIVRGHVQDPLRSFAVFNLYDPNTGITRYDTVKLHDGSFAFDVKTEHSWQPVVLELDSIRAEAFYIAPGCDITIEFGKDGAVSFKGNLAEMAKYEHHYFKKRKELQRAYLNRNPAMREPAFREREAYVRILDSIMHDQIEFLETYFGNKPSRRYRDFIRYRKNGLVYENLYYKQCDNEMQPGGSLGEITFTDASLFADRDYRRFVRAYIINEITARRNARGTPFLWADAINDALHVCESLNTTPSRAGLEILFLGATLEELERTKNREGALAMRNVLDSLRQGRSNSALLPIRQQLTRLIESDDLKEGYPAPAFALRDTLGNIVTLASLKGRKVVIDVGASTCGPCIAALPAWNKKVRSNADAETIYIYLSLDSSEKAWRDFIRKYRALGLHLYAGEGGFRSRFARDYQIGSLPGYIEIDDQGNILKYQ